MTIIFFLYLAIFPFLLFIFCEKVRYSKKLFLAICFFQLFFFYSFRSIDVGIDTLSYITVYNNFDTNVTYQYYFSHYEIGFQTIYNILKFFNAGEQWVLIVCGVIIHSSIAIFIYKNSKNIILSTFLYTCLFFPNSMNIIRQYLSVAIAVHFIYFLLKDKYFYSILIIILASLFHQIALVFLLFVLIYALKTPKMIMSLFFIFLFLIIIFPNQFTDFIMQMSSSGEYYSTEDFVVQRNLRLTTILTIIEAILCIFTNYKIKHKKNGREIDLYAFFSLFNLIMGILYLRNEIFSRIIEFVNIYLINSLPYIRCHLRCYYKPLINVLIYLIPVLLLIISASFGGSGVNHYHMLFF